MPIYQKINNNLPQKNGNVAIGGPRRPLYGDSTFRYEESNRDWYNQYSDVDIREYNVVIEASGAEASLTLPDGTSKLEFQFRPAQELRWGFTQGNPSGEVDPYWTLHASDAYYQDYDGDGLINKTIYFSSNYAGVVEVRCLS